MDYLTVNRNRRANRDYDPNFKLGRETLERLLNEAALAPSSYGMQGWNAIVLLSEAEKKRLHPLAMSQPQVLTAAAIVIVIGDLHAYKGLRHILEQSPGTPPQIIESYIRYATTQYSENLQAQRDEAFRGTALFAMNFMLAAANEGLDTGPMGGFDPASVSREFGIHEPYFPTLLISVGKATKVQGPRGYRVPASEFADFR